MVSDELENFKLVVINVCGEGVGLRQQLVFRIVFDKTTIDSWFLLGR